MEMLKFACEAELSTRKTKHVVAGCGVRPNAGPDGLPSTRGIGAPR